MVFRRGTQKTQVVLSMNFLLIKDRQGLTNTKTNKTFRSAPINPFVGELYGELYGNLTADCYLRQGD